MKRGRGLIANDANRRMMRINWIRFARPLVLFAFPLFLLLQTKTLAETVRVANGLYAVGAYGEAIELYEEVVESNGGTADVYFNLGNSRFQQENWGEAIVSYRRAARLAPRDGDVRANLALARGQVESGVTTDGDGTMGQIAWLTSSWLTVNETAVFLLVSWFLLLLAFAGWRHWRSGLRYPFALLLLLFLLVGASLSSRAYLDEVRPAAVVVVGNTAVYGTPNDQTQPTFTLADGVELVVIDQRNEWSQITLPGNNFQGWVDADSLAFVKTTEQP